MPLTPSGKRIQRDFRQRYGKDGDRVFYASINSGRLPQDRVEGGRKRSTTRSGTRKHAARKSSGRSLR